MTVGNNTNAALNPICVAMGAIIDGGWYLCPTAMIGTTFGIYTTAILNFMEAMAYSQEAIQMNAMSVSFIGTNVSAYPAINAI